MKIMLVVLKMALFGSSVVYLTVTPSATTINWWLLLDICASLFPLIIAVVVMMTAVRAMDEERLGNMDWIQIIGVFGGSLVLISAGPGMSFVVGIVCTTITLSVVSLVLCIKTSKRYCEKVLSLAQTCSGLMKTPKSFCDVA